MTSLILVLLAGILNAIMDVISFHFEESVFKNYPKFCNPTISWKNKYSNIYTKTPKHFGSTAFLIMFTDLWHLCKFLMILCFCSSIITYNSYFGFSLDLIFHYLAFSITFELFYSKLLKS